MNNLDNLAIMNYLQGHGLIGGVIHRKPKKHLMKYDLEGGVITDATRTGLAKYRAFIAYEKKIMMHHTKKQSQNGKLINQNTQ